jgi:hypothetical protein
VTMASELSHWGGGGRPKYWAPLPIDEPSPNEPTLLGIFERLEKSLTPYSSSEKTGISLFETTLAPVVFLSSAR